MERLIYQRVRHLEKFQYTLVEMDSELQEMQPDDVRPPVRGVANNQHAT